MTLVSVRGAGVGEVASSGKEESDMKGPGAEGGERGAGGRVFGQSPYGPALERARVQAQVPVPLISRLLLGAVLM